MKLTDWVSIQVRHCKWHFGDRWALDSIMLIFIGNPKIQIKIGVKWRHIRLWSHFFCLQTLQNISKDAFFYLFYFCCFVVLVVFQSVDLFILESVTKVNSAFRHSLGISWIANFFFSNCTPRKGAKAKTVPFKEPRSDTLYIICTFSPVHSVKHKVSV